MSEKLIVHKIPVEMQKQSIEETYMLILFLELRGKYLKSYSLEKLEKMCPKDKRLFVRSDLIVL